MAAGGSGILFVAASLLSLVRLRQVRWSTIRDALFLVGLTVVFVFQILQGADLLDRPDDADPVDTIAILVVVCFLVGISRSWELMGGPSFGFTHEVVAMVRGREPEPRQSGRSVSVPGDGEEDEVPR